MAQKLCVSLSAVLWGVGCTPTPSAPAKAVTSISLRCEDVVDAIERPPESYTSVLDVVAFATSLPQTAPREELLFSKSGLVVRAGRAFTLSVKPGSSTRIGWGHGAEPSERVVVPACPGSRDWLAFVGGFWVKEPECVELVVREGEREAVARIGVGAACPGP